MNDTLRGHAIYFDGEQWRYKDNQEPTTENWQSRSCGHCHLPNRADEHDACLGRLPGVINACCGHGDTRQAYIMYEDGETERAEEAQEAFKNG